MAGAWRELVDLGRDLGIAGAGGPSLTRREFAAHAGEHGLPAAGAVAVAADAAVFGPAEPDDTAAAGVWQLVAAARHEATASLPLRRRAWVAVNPVSLWASPAPATGSSLRHIASLVYHVRHERSTPRPPARARRAAHS